MSLRSLPSWPSHDPSWFHLWSAGGPIPEVRLWSKDEPLRWANRTREDLCGCYRSKSSLSLFRESSPFVSFTLLWSEKTQYWLSPRMSSLPFPLRTYFVLLMFFLSYLWKVLSLPSAFPCRYFHSRLCCSVYPCPPKHCCITKGSTCLLSTSCVLVCTSCVLHTPHIR